jgi:erythrocyte band 7 integral membrane protein
LHGNLEQSEHEDQCDGPFQTGILAIMKNIITKDNVSINIDASVYFRVINARYAYYRVQNLNAAIAEVTYAILKNTCGQFVLQDILEKRQEISDDI